MNDKIVEWSGKISAVGQFGGGWIVQLDKPMLLDEGIGWQKYTMFAIVNNDTKNKFNVEQFGKIVYRKTFLWFKKPFRDLQDLKVKGLGTLGSEAVMATKVLINEPKYLSNDGKTLN